MELGKELAEEMEKQFEHDMEVAKQASMEVEVEKKQQLMICDFPVKRSFQDERFNKLYRAIHGRVLKMDAVETAKAKKQMQIHPKFLEFLMHFDCPYDEVDLMASWDLWCEHNGVVKVDEPIPPTVERHTTKENINKFFDPKTYKATEGDGLPTPEKPAEHGGGPGAELPPKSESVEDEKFALLTAADQRRLRTSRKDENAEKKTRHTKKGPPKSSASAVPAEKEKKRPVEVEEQEQEEPKENDNKRRKSAQLVDKDRQEEFKKNLKLSFNQVFCLGKAYVFFLGGKKLFLWFETYSCTFHCRLVKNTKRFSLNIYWTRLQVGVRNKDSKRQVWTTSLSTAVPSFGDKIRLGNAAVTYWKMRCVVCITRFGSFIYYSFFLK